VSSCGAQNQPVIGESCIHLFMQRFLFQIIFWVLSSGLLNAQQAQRVSLLSTDEGLSQGSNHFLHEDKKGFMWITALDAINRYDGTSVKVYNLKRHFDGAPVLREGFGFVEDSASNLYVGSANGLYQYVRATDKFRIISHVFSEKTKAVLPICLEGDVLYCFNHLYQFFAYYTKTGKVTSLPDIGFSAYKSLHTYDLEGKFFQNRFPKVDKEGQIWFVGDSEVKVFDLKAQRFYTLDLVGTELLNCQAYDSLRHKLYVGCSSGIYSIDCKTKLIEQIRDIPGRPNQKIISISTYENKIVLAEEKFGTLLTDEKFSFFQDLKFQDRILNRFSRVYYDNLGRLWAAEDGIGLWVLDDTQTFLQKGKADASIKKEFEEMGVNYFAELPNGKVIIREGILLDTTTEVLSRVIEIAPNIRCETDRTRKGVWAWSRNPNKKLEMYFVDAQLSVKPQKLKTTDRSKGHFQDLKVLPDGRMLCAFSAGLFWFLPQLGSFEPIDDQKRSNCFYISLLDEKQIAVSYLNAPMQIFRIAGTGKLELTHTFSDDEQAYYMEKDSVRNRYWVGTTSGVFLLNQHFQVIRHFDPNSGLSGSNIYGLLLDHFGNCYASHQRGLSSINAETFHTINFSRADGIQDWDYNNRAFYKSSTGTLYFGGVSGFNFIKSPFTPGSKAAAEVYLDEVWVNSRDSFPLAHEEFRSGKLSLLSHQNQLTIRPRLKSLYGSAGLKICYRFKRTEKDWKYCDIGSDIMLSSLAPGQYALEYGYYDPYLNRHTAQNEFKFIISAPFYQSNWFMLLCSFLAFSLIYWLVYRAQMRKQITAINRERALAKQRSDITADLHDEIGSTLSSLQLNSSVALAVLDQEPEKAKTILQKIEGQSANLSDKIGDIIWSIKPRTDEFMTISARIKSFTSEILDSTHINYSIQIDDAIDTRIQDAKTRKNTVLLVKEAINNAAKYSKASQLSLSIVCSENKMQVTINDNGIGFNPEEAKTGNGLLNMRRRANDLGGQFSILSAQGLGTTIEASIPIVT
jgi:signal transduction histidine kinase/ligand-binding sensor domain-containing protein